MSSVVAPTMRGAYTKADASLPGKAKSLPHFQPITDTLKWSELVPLGTRLYGRTLPQRYREFGLQRVACTTTRLRDLSRSAGRSYRKGRPERGLRMEESCFICGICEAGKDESGVLFCGCKGYIRYVVWGTLPLHSPKRRGPKPAIEFDDVWRKIDELPMSAGLQRVADELGVKRDVVLRVIRPYVKALREEYDPNCVGFRGFQAVVKGRGKPRIPASRQKNLLPD